MAIGHTHLGRDSCCTSKAAARGAGMQCIRAPLSLRENTGKGSSSGRLGLLTPQILEHHRIGGLAVADHGRPARAARGIELGQADLKTNNGNFEITIQISRRFLFVKEPILWTAKNVREDPDSNAALSGGQRRDRMEITRSLERPQILCKSHKRGLHEKAVCAASSSGVLYWPQRNHNKRHENSLP